MVKKIRQPKGTPPLRKEERAYEMAIKENVLNPLKANIDNRIAEGPQFKTAYSRAVEQEIDNFDIETASTVAAITGVDGLRRAHKVRMVKKFKSAIGVDIGSMMSDVALRPLMEQALATNINLIKSIPDTLKSQVLDVFDDVFSKQGFDQQVMVKALEGRFKVASNRAKFIARDQVGKITGQLNEVRQGQLGITSYIWQTAEDERVVGTPGGEFPDPNPGHGDHFSRNGVTYPWTFKHQDGHPGEAFNCRCVAIPILPELQQEAVNE